MGWDMHRDFAVKGLNGKPAFIPISKLVMTHLLFGGWGPRRR